MLVFKKLSDLLSKFYAQQLEPLLFRRRRAPRLQAFLPSAQLSDLPIANLQFFGTAAVNQASPLIARYQRYYQQFYQQPVQSAPPQDPAGIAMLLPLHRYQDATDFCKSLKKRAGNFWRDAERARRSGFMIHPFVMANHTPDLLSIRRSRKLRAFGPVLDAFTLKIQDLGGAPSQLQQWQTPACNEHWDLYFGVFRAQPGYLQGTVETGEQLLAYARLHRIGNTLRYAELMGHAEFQQQGVMSMLHLDLIRLLLTRDEAWLNGIDYLTYGALEQGSDGLIFWKRKAQFQPYILRLQAEINHHH